MERMKKLPFFVKGITVVIFAGVLVFAAALGLRVLEEKQQKPRVLKAIAELAAEAGDERYRLDGFLEMLQGGELAYSGKLQMTELEAGLLPKQYQYLAPYLNKTALQFMLKKAEPEEKAVFSVEARLHGRLPLNAEGYLDAKECILRIPSLHESYLSFSPENVKAQYEESLLYTLLGNALLLPEENLADYVFNGREEKTGGEAEALSRNLFGLFKSGKDFYDSITVNKTGRKEDILRNGSYESCTEYRMSVPAEPVNRFLKEMTEHTLLFTEERLDLLVYLNSRKQLTKLVLEGSPKVDARKLPLTLAFYPKGADNAWDSLLLEAEILLENTAYDFTLVCSNEFTGAERILHVNFSMAQPFVTELLDMDMVLEPEGNASFDFACQIPGFALDGICQLDPLTEKIERPQVEAVRIFELNLFDILKFTNGLNWNFFKNQE